MQNTSAVAASHAAPKTGGKTERGGRGKGPMRGGWLLANS